MKFSIIVVCLNPGEKLNETLDSVLCQSFTDYEIVVKDGGSKDGSLENMRRDERIRLTVSSDRGIYDAMNQAVALAQGDFVLFLNCGDKLYDEAVLERAARLIQDHPEQKKLVLYGNTYGEKNHISITASPVINGFACYRNIPCHQSCIYAAALCREKPYDEKYKIRADYDHFLWCYFQAGAKMIFMDCTVASYEGGGYSESKENIARDRQEHREITAAYMSASQLAKYRLIMALTLAPLRSFLAENRLFSGFYHWIKTAVYRGKK